MYYLVAILFSFSFYFLLPFFFPFASSSFGVLGFLFFWGATGRSSTILRCIACELFYPTSFLLFTFVRLVFFMDRSRFYSLLTLLLRSHHCIACEWFCLASVLLFIFVRLVLSMDRSPLFSFPTLSHSIPPFPNLPSLNHKIFVLLVPPILHHFPL